MANQKICLVLVGLFSLISTEYIPPGPAYPCPKDSKSQLLFPCVCEKGTDTGLFIRCENVGLAVLSVGLGNIAGLGFPIERLVLNECKISKYNLITCYISNFIVCKWAYLKLQGINF